MSYCGKSCRHQGEEHASTVGCKGVSLTAGFWKVFSFERPSVEDGLELLREA